MAEDKLFVTAQSLLADSYELAAQILRSAFRPTHIAGVWRGGAPVGIAVQEALAYHGVETDHIAVRTSVYTGIGEMAETVRVHGLEYLVHQLAPEHRLLIIDDVFDTGRSIEALMRALQDRCGPACPQDIRTATVYYKPAHNRTQRVPDYCVHETARWLVFPHEMCGLSREEIAASKPLPPDFFDLKA